LKEPIDLTIGLAVYNGEKKIQSALDSLINQTYKNFILIISDNASTDKTEEICRAYAKKDPRIKYIRNKENMGMANNFQKLLSIAKTPYFMWASHDDIWEPTFATEILEVLKENKEAVLAFCGFDFIYGDNDKQKSPLNQVTSKLEIIPYLRFKNLKSRYDRLKVSIHQNLGMFTYSIYHTDILKKSGGFPSQPHGGYAMDNLLLLKLAYYGPFLFHSKLLFHKRQRVYPPTKRSLISKIKNLFSSTKDFLMKQTGFQVSQRKIIRKLKISFPQKISLTFNTYIAQIFTYIVIFLGSFTLSNSNVKRLLKIMYKIFLKDRIL